MSKVLRARSGDTRNEYRISARKSFGKWPLEGLRRRRRRRGDDNTKMDLRKADVERGRWVDLAQDHLSYWQR
jgi:hypothetical protein